MISKDHRLLGRFLARQIKNTSPLAIHLFVTGCVFPDHNPLTYLRGVCMGHPLKTHFLFLSYPEIIRLCNKLENRKRLYLWDYYSLGALVHYAADAFTFPHNEHYTGSMLEHAEYEHNELHPVFEQYLREDFYMEGQREYDRQSLGSLFSQMHDSYRDGEASPLWDAGYICRISTVICERVLAREKVTDRESSNRKVGYVQA